ncbi:putative phosphoglycerate mutase [Scopulibacillus daqui]|uniref:Phosphoglycerate mutase n=1 Tax=Scopulibacillus daqui TaxID=1469162 RepID=A0ABS2Q0A1_9BACL|nr:histidine phosphatase family protein [Scopulibacillus daqui]MBM7645725.1 putative phosphoglycerate mutase [Scopulibacillus daqui]
MQRLFLTGHGETEWNVEERMQGRKNSLLTKRGKEEAAWLSQRLSGENINLIISSPSPRTLETAEIIRADRDIKIIQDEHFLEMDAGDWEGRKIDEIKQEYPEKSYLFWHQPHLFISKNGEDFYQVRERVLPRLKYLLNQYQDKNLLIVSHPVVLKVLLSYFEKRPLEQLWEGKQILGASLSTIEINGDHSRIIQYADMKHFRVMPFK